MKRTAIAIAVGALSAGLSHGLLAQEEDTQQLDGEQESEQFDTQQQSTDTDQGQLGDEGVQDSEFTDEDSEQGSQGMDGQDDLMSLEASELEGRDIVSQEGDEFGEIDHVARNTQTDELHAVVTEGGFLGIGADEYAIPLSELDAQDDDQVVLRGSYGDEELEQFADSYDEDNFEELDGDQRLSDSQNQGDGNL